MNKNDLKIFNLPNLLTTFNLLSGIFSIFLSFSGRIDLAPYPIFLGAFFDFLDGFAARLLKQQGELGKQLDSLADMITFGLAPGVMMMNVICIISYGEYYPNLNNAFIQWIANHHYYSLGFMMPFFGLLIPVFSMYRLAKFNIDERQTDSFIGVPTPANTLFFCTFPLVLNQLNNDGILSNMFLNEYVIIGLIFLMSFLLISELPLFSLKFKHFKWKSNEIRYLFLISCLLIIPLIRFWSLGFIVLLYLLLSLIENYLKKHKHEIQS